MDKLLLDLNDLKEILSCGRQAAIRIGTEAGAVVYIGSKRVYRRDKIEEYIMQTDRLTGRIRTN